MPTPNIFISSTFYDLKYIRQSLRSFVDSFGYNPILSEQGTVFFDPERSAADSAVGEVPNCQLFILIIGGRYGTEHKASNRSITNAEYQEAVRQQIPVYALVERGTLTDYEMWIANKDGDVNVESINFPHADDLRIFDFIDEVRSQVANNALVSFEDFSDIEEHLRRQWAYLLHSFLSHLKKGGRAPEYRERSNQRDDLLELFATNEATLVAEMYDLMLASPAIGELTALGLRPTPIHVLNHEEFFACAKALGGEWKIVSGDDAEPGKEGQASPSGKRGTMSTARAAEIRRSYADLRGALHRCREVNAERQMTPERPPRGDIGPNET